MNRFEAFAELKGHLVPAVSVLGVQRVALGIGRHVSTVETWMRLSQVELRMAAIEEVLPRLRNWRSWMPKYLTELSEAERLTQELVSWSDLVTEFRQLVASALNRYPLAQVAMGCELKPNRFVKYYLESPQESEDRPLLQKAVAHLRHWEAWPVAGAEKVEEATPQLV